MMVGLPKSSHASHTERHAADLKPRRHEDDVPDFAAPIFGTPVLQSSRRWMGYQLDKAIELGDHVLVVGKVLDLDVVGSDDHPTVFSRGAYPVFGY